jgi:molybdopterin-guanine dinucleotide biosynthesis protein A
MPQRTTAAALLRGGLARRFGGQDKSRLVVDGRTIIVRQVEVLQRVASEIFIVGARAGETSDAGLAVHADRIPGMGVIGGIFTALDVTEADAVVVVGCDLPFLDAGVLAELVRLAATADGAWVRTARGPEPLIACYRRRDSGRPCEGLRPRDDPAPRGARGRRARSVRAGGSAAHEREHAG